MSSLAMSIYLTHESTPPVWGDAARVSFQAECVLIHWDELDPFKLLHVQKAARGLIGQGLRVFKLCGDAWTTDAAFAFYQGAFSAKEKITIAYTDQTDPQGFTQLVEIIHWVRRLINQPASTLTPMALAQSAVNFLQRYAPETITSNMICGETLAEQGYMGVYTVGKGSVNPPVLLEVDYNPSGKSDTPVDLCLVGKGITFDSGGYSLKPSDSMIAMKSDMGGAATVTGALALAIARGLTKRVKLFLCCAENMISGNAFRLGDIIHYKNDISVEVLNTDAEGRLVLADGYIAASETQAPVLIDAATLTGSAKAALGREYHAVFSKDLALSQKVVQCAQAEHEYAWALPLAHWHTEQLASAFADIGNVSMGEGCAGASTAAAFLARFLTPNVKSWVHLDLSASYQPSANALWSAGGKGHGVRMIARMIQEFTQGR